MFLDQDGVEGWELVSTVTLASRLLLLLKRPLEFAEEAVEEPVTEELEQQPETYLSEQGEQLEAEAEAELPQAQE